MWSHTIQTSKTKAPANERSAKANGPATPSKRSSVDAEDMTQGFDADGFSKTSRVRAVKKPLTVAKAPVLGRTTSSKAEGQPATPKENARPAVGKPIARAPPAPSKSATPLRTAKTAPSTQSASSATRARPPVLSSRTRTPTQAGTSNTGRSTVRSPKAEENTRGHVVKVKHLLKGQSPTLGNDEDDALETDQATQSADEGTNIVEPAEDQSSLDANAAPLGSSHPDRVGDGSGHEEVEGNHSQLIGEKGNRLEDADRGSHEKLNREIAHKNQTIKALRHDLQESQKVCERNLEDMESKAAQTRSLRSELDSVRNTLVDLNDTHQSTLEKHDSLLRSRDKIIQNLSHEAESLRIELGANSQDKEQRRGPTGQNEHLPSKDEEIQSLSETVQDLRKQLEAVDIARAKEIYDELLRSKDKEIASVSGVVKDLRGELEATDRAAGQENYDQLLLTKDEEIKSLSEMIQSLEEKIDANDKVKELSFRGEFQDLQNKLKRKAEDLEAAAATRVAKLQADYDELLQLRDQEIKEVGGMAEDLQKEIESIHENQKQESQKMNVKHEKRLRDVRAEFDEKLLDVHARHEQDLNSMRGVHNEFDLKHTSEIQELSRKHRHELESARTDQQNADTNHQQELRETRRKHEETLENVKQDAQGELRDEIARLQHEIDDKTAKHSQEIEQAEAQHRTEIETTSRNHEQILKDVSLRHERELAEANTKYQKELTDVERLRGEGSNEVSQEHENQLEAIAKKYQQELAEAAQKYDDTLSSHGQQLQEVKASYEEIKVEADRCRNQLENVQQKHETLEREKQAQEEKLSELPRARDQALEIAAAKHQEAIDQATAKHRELTASIEKHSTEHLAKVDRVEQLEREIEHELSISEIANAEIASLRNTLQELELSRSKLQEDTELIHKKELQDANSKHERDLSHLHAEFEAAATEIISLKNVLKESANERVEMDKAAALEHEQRLRDTSSEHDQAMVQLRSEHDTTLAEMAAVQAELQDLNHRLDQEHANLKDTLKNTELAKEEARVEIALLNDRLELASHDKNAYEGKVNRLTSDLEKLRGESSNLNEDLVHEKKEAAVEVALQKDKLELKILEVHKYQETIKALHEDIDRLQVQLTESSEIVKRDRNEAAVEIALLKDRLELSELQKQSAAEDTSLSRNESNVEIALLKDKLELSDLQTQQDKEAIGALENRLKELHAQPVDTNSFVHQQLRDDLAMLARHHAANLADVEALKESILAERDVREAEWKKRALSRDHLNKDMQGMRAELSGIVGAH